MRVTTEIDLDLAKHNVKLAQLKLDLKSLEAEARKVKIGENLVSREAQAEVAKIAQLKQQLATVAFEAGMKELAPAQQLYAITQQIARLKAQAFEAGPIRESQALQLELQAGQLMQRRAGILASMNAEKQQSVVLAQRELSIQSAQAAEARRLLAIEELQNAAAQRRALLSSSALARGGYGGRSGPGGAYVAGQLGLQVQDVAVQLQAGTNPVTILAQQGSQIASVLGPKGMIAGGMIAIGAAAVTMGRLNKQAFEELIQGAKDSEGALSRLNDLSSLSELGAGLKKAREQVVALKEARSGLNSFSGLLGTGLAFMMGGESRNEKIGQILLARERAEQRVEALQQRSIESSTRELQITELRAQKKNYEADQLERIAALQREIAGIVTQGYDARTQERLIELAEENAAIKENAAWAVESERRKKVADEEAAKIATVRLARLQAEGAEYARIAALKQQAADASFEGGLKGLQLEDQAAALEKRAAGLWLNARDNGPIQKSQELELQAEMNKLLQRASEIRADESKRAAILQFSRLEWDLENKLLEAKSKSLGKEDATVTALDNKLKAMRLAKSYQDNFNVSAQTALNMANARVTAENNVTNALKAQAAAEANNNLANRMRIAQLQGAGRNAAAAKLQAQIKQADLAKEIKAADPALTDEEANTRAKDLIKAEDKANRRQARDNGETVPGAKIEGGRSRRSKTLEEYKNDTSKPTDQLYDPKDYRHPKNRLMQGQMAPNLGPGGQQMQQPHQNAANQQALNANVFSLAEAGTIITLLTDIRTNLKVAN